jgi:hypothetical protein
LMPKGVIAGWEFKCDVVHGMMMFLWQNPYEQGSFFVY